MTAYDRLGGHAGVEALIEAFVGRMFDDFVIGFLFQGRDRERIVRHETELAVAHLGGPAAYTGRPIGQTHRPLKINRGHFRRRLAILRTVLREHDVPGDVIEAWVGHDAALEDVVSTGVECVP